jgi:hypothetical protein
MQESGPQFFSSAGLAADEHGAFDIGRPFDMARNAIYFWVRAEHPAIRIFRREVEQRLNGRGNC